MKICKKLVCIVLVMVMSFSLNSGAILAATTASYALSYDSGSPYNVDTDTKTIAASGNDYFRVEVSKFSISLSGGYMQAKGKSYATGSKNFTGTGTQKLVFTGSTIPKKGVNITVSLKLYPYANYMRVSGNVKQ